MARRQRKQRINLQCRLKNFNLNLILTCDICTSTVAEELHTGNDNHSREKGFDKDDGAWLLRFIH